MSLAELKEKMEQASKARQHAEFLVQCLIELESDTANAYHCAWFKEKTQGIMNFGDALLVTAEAAKYAENNFDPTGDKLDWFKKGTLVLLEGIHDEMLQVGWKMHSVNLPIALVIQMREAYLAQ